MQQVEMACRGIRINQFLSIVKIFLYNDIFLFSISYLNLQHYCRSNITIIYVQKYAYIYISSLNVTALKSPVTFIFFIYGNMVTFMSNYDVFCVKIETCKDQYPAKIWTITYTTSKYFNLGVKATLITSRTIHIRSNSTVIFYKHWLNDQEYLGISSP